MNGLKYYKGFWMFNSEDREYNDDNLSGYAKMEMKKDGFVINVTIFNIKNNLKYKIYFIRSDNYIFKNICLGDLKINKNTGTLSYTIPNIPDISKFNVLAVVSVIEGENGIKILAPAVAYKDKKVSWRENLKNEIRSLKCRYYCPIIRRKMNFGMLSNNFNIEIFKRQVDINFKRCDPFLNKRQDYVWWSVPDIRKLYYFLKLFDIDIRDTASGDIAILGLYENYIMQKAYIILGFLIKNDFCNNRFDKVVKIKDSNLSYGLIFLNPYLKEKAN